MMSMFSEKVLVKVSQCRVRAKIAPVSKSGPVETVQPSHLPEIMKVFPFPFLFWNLCNCIC